MRAYVVMIGIFMGGLAGSALASNQVDLNGSKATKLAANAKVRALAKQVGDPGMRVFGASFKLAPTDLAKNLIGTRALYFGHDVMFRANRDINKETWDPAAMRLNLQQETMNVRRIAAGSAASSFYAAIKDSSAKPGTLKPVVQKLVTALIGRSSGRVYRLHWDNRDDTDYNAIMIVNLKTGRIGVVTSSPDI